MPRRAGPDARAPSGDCADAPQRSLHFARRCAADHCPQRSALRGLCEPPRLLAFHARGAPSGCTPRNDAACASESARRKSRRHDAFIEGGTVGRHNFGMDYRDDSRLGPHAHCRLGLLADRLRHLPPCFKPRKRCLDLRNSRRLRYRPFVDYSLNLRGAYA